MHVCCVICTFLPSLILLSSASKSPFNGALIEYTGSVQAIVSPQPHPAFSFTLDSPSLVTTTRCLFFALLPRICTVLCRYADSRRSCGSRKRLPAPSRGGSRAGRRRTGLGLAGEIVSPPRRGSPHRSWLGCQRTGTARSTFNVDVRNYIFILSCQHTNKDM